MLKTALGALLSHWRRHPVQFATFIVGLSLATALWSAVQAINGEARASYAKAAQTLGQDRVAALVRKDGARFDQTTYIALRRAGWLVSPVIEGEKRFGDQRLKIYGIDPLTAPPQSQTVDLGESGSLADFVTPPGNFYTSPETAKKLAGQSTPPVRVVDAIPLGVVITDIGVAQGLLNAPGQVSRLLLSPTQTASRTPLAEIAPELEQRVPDAAGDLARLTDSFHLNLTAFAFLAFAVGLFIVHSAIGLAFEQRRPVFRTLRALGVSSRALVAIVGIELLGFAVVAGAIGVVIGYLIAVALLPDVAATLSGIYGASVPGSLALRPSTWVAGLGIAIFGTLISAAQGLFTVWRLPVLASAKPRAWAQASRQALVYQLIGAGLLLATAAVLMTSASGLVAGFVALAALLLGVALALPAMLMAGLHVGALLSRGVIANWFWADARQQLPGLSLALTAMLLALAANIGVGTMVSSFRSTFVGWIDQRLASELYVSARTEDEARALRDWLKARADAVLPIWNVDGDVAGMKAQIFGIADHATYRDKWPMLDGDSDVWDRIARGADAVINEQLARRKKIKVGDVIVLPDGFKPRVAGIYSDYGNPNAQVIIGIDRFMGLYPDASKLRYGVRIAPEKVASLVEDMKTTFDLPDSNFLNQQAAKEMSIKTFDRTFTVTGALNVLTLAVASLAMFASLLTIASMRLPQLAPLWAMGVTRPKLAVLEVFRSFVLATMTAIAAIPLGLMLAWVLLAVINVEAFGWRLPMLYFPWEWLRLAVLGILAVTLSAAWSAWHLARLKPAELIKVFADER